MIGILYIGMSVHTTKNTLCTCTMEMQKAFGRMQVEPDYKNILKYIEKMEEAWGDDIEIVCGSRAVFPTKLPLAFSLPLVLSCSWKTPIKSQ